MATLESIFLYLNPLIAFLWIIFFDQTRYASGWFYVLGFVISLVLMMKLHDFIEKQDFIK